MNEIHHDNESSRVSDEGPRVSTSPIEKLREEQELSIQRGASDHSQGFEDKNLGSSPVCLGSR